MVRTWRIILGVLLTLSVCIPGRDAWATPRTLTSASFCELDALSPDRPCAFSTITFPHDWTPKSPGASLGLYRIVLPRPPDGDYALLLDRMSLDGAVEVNGRRVFDRLNPDRITRQRYWPLIARFGLLSGDSGGLTVDIIVRGHAQTKNGLGRVRMTGLAEGEDIFRRDLIFDVVTVAAAAAAGLLAGVMGLLIGDPSNRTGRVLSATSWLAIAASVRCLHNLISAPPVGPAAWLTIGTWLLALIALQAIFVVLTYLQPKVAHGPVNALLAAGIALGLSLAVSAGVLGPAMTLTFAALVLVAATLLFRLILVTVRRPEPLGWAILLVFAIILATGAHDLIMHLGRNSLSDGYLQGWALPVVITLSVLALARRAAEQRQLESALVRSDSRREDLIRDLHDRVGSRLVALAFHAQQDERNPVLVEEIRDLMTEVRMIQSAVATEATTLEALLADLRHHYARVGGGRLPLDWRIEEGIGRIQLGPEQVVAVARIIEEAIANAVRHASPSRIVIRLLQRAPEDPVELCIENDGEGIIRPAPSGGGLNNMRVRAERAGFSLDFLNGPEMRTIRIRFPKPRRSLAKGLFRSLQPVLPELRKARKQSLRR